MTDISTLSDRSIYVLGKAPGRTTLTLLSPEGQLISNVDVQVTPDVAEFKERLRQILPGEAGMDGFYYAALIKLPAVPQGAPCSPP